MNELPIKQPPHSIQSEQAVLGGLMLDNRHWPDVSEVITSADFYREDHRIIFSAMADMLEAKEPADFVTLSQRLKERNEADVADLTYLGALANDTPSSANTVAYARNVRSTSIRRQLIKAGQEVADAGFRGGENVAASVDAAQKSVMAIGESSAEDLPTDIGEFMPEWERDLRDARAGNRDAGMPWGWADVDSFIGGLYPGWAVFLLGRPGMGKSVAAVNIADFAARQGRKVLLFSLEMSRKEIADRIVASRARVGLDHVRDPSKASDEEMSRIAQQSGAIKNIIVDDRVGLTINQIRARCRRVSRSVDLSMVVIDYFQLIRGQGEENRTRELGAAAQGIKELAKELGVPIVVPTQVGRQAESRGDKKPTMADARDCGDIEQAGDIIAGLYRPHYYDANAPDNLLELMILKFRHGPTGTVKLNWSGAHSSIDNLARHDAAWEWGTDRGKPTPRRQWSGGFDAQAMRGSNAA